MKAYSTVIVIKQNGYFLQKITRKFSVFLVICFAKKYRINFLVPRMSPKNSKNYFFFQGLNSAQTSCGKSVRSFIRSKLKKIEIIKSIFLNTEKTFEIF